MKVPVLERLSMKNDVCNVNTLVLIKRLQKHGALATAL